jgi:hypothetical protein
MLEPLQGLQVFLRLRSQKLDPPHDLHLLLSQLISQMPDPPQFLLCRLCSQMPSTPHCLHPLLSRLFLQMRQPFAKLARVSLAVLLADAQPGTTHCLLAPPQYAVVLAC